MISRLKVPCSYQGGKQRIAGEIAEHLLAAAKSENTLFYDLCSGSGAISVELVNRGISPSRIIMLDNSSWGSFWKAIGDGEFDFQVFENLVESLPPDKKAIKPFVSALATQRVVENEAELYLILQACSFGGKQIWLNEGRWTNAFFRDVWEPTATSVRQSTANPMQPNAAELKRRVFALQKGMAGLKCLRQDIFTILDNKIPDDSVVYVDPPYRGTTGYGYGFDLQEFVSMFLQSNTAPLFVSEGFPLVEEATKISFGGANGGISGKRAVKHEEWLSLLRANPSA